MKKTLLLMAILLTGTYGCAKNPAPASSSEPAPTPAATTTYTVKTIGTDIHGAEAILNAIKADYKGRVVLIDFWATWCPPCRAAMRDVDAIKPALQAKGAAFVYITGETSPLADWEKAIPAIAGDHYRLTKDQWQELITGLNMPGIPAYLLLGKDGSVAFSNITEGGYPGNDIIQNNIEVALTK